MRIIDRVETYLPVIKKENVRSNILVVALCLVLIAGTFLVYGQMAGHEFLNYDDDTYVTDVPRLKAGLNINNVKWAFTTTYANFWHPLTWLSYMLDAELFGADAGMHHMTNLLLHIASTVILFLLLLRSTGSKWASAACAALFAVHPLHVESVAWIAERKDTLSTLFWMLTMLAYVWYAERPGIKRYMLVVVSFCLGMMAKPMLVTLPFVLLLFDWWPLARLKNGLFGASESFVSNKKRIITLVLEKVPLFIITISASIVAVIAQKGGGALGSLDKYPMGVRTGNAIVSYVGYIGKTLWPFGLVVPYPHPGAMPLWKIAGALLILAVISFFVIRQRLKRPYLIVGWLWYLGTLVPVIGLLQLGGHGMADRYTYVPLIGLCIMLSWGVKDIMNRWPHKKQTAVLLTGAAFGALMIISWIQVGYWQNSIKLFTHTLEVIPENLPALNNMGTALVEAGDPEKGEEYFRRGMKINPEHSVVYHNLGYSRQRQGDIKGAVKYYSMALEFNPGQVQTHSRLADILAERGELDRALFHYSAVLKIKPGKTEVYGKIGNILVAQGKYPEAIQYYTEALKRRPDYATYYNLGFALLESGRLDEAIYQFSESLMMNPNNSMAHNNMANALARQGNLNEAVIHYSEALRINPDFKEAHSNFGILLKKHGKNKEAIYQFSEVLRIDPDDAKARQNLETLRD